MKKLILLILIALITSTTLYAQEQKMSPQAKEVTVAEVDKELIETMALHGGQISAYSAIMKQQRKAIIALKPHQWQERVALYEETITLLRQVLNPEQHAKFVAYVSCFIEEARQASRLAIGPAVSTVTYNTQKY